MVENTNGAKYWWQAECKDMMAKKRGYTYKLHKMSPTVLGCCDEGLRGKVKNRADFDSLESSDNTLALLNAIKKEGHGV